MTREEARKIIDALVALRDKATDADALNAIDIYPVWRADRAYAVDQRLRHNGILYKTLIPHTSQSDWTPDVSPSLFVKVLIPDENVIPEWEQPDSTNTYSKGDKVRHNGKIWISTVDNNSWEPGVYGWEEVI